MQDSNLAALSFSQICRHVQSQINLSHHRAINLTPFEATFGRIPHLPQPTDDEIDAIQAEIDADDADPEDVEKVN